jgi:hypothetical protein
VIADDTIVCHMGLRHDQIVRPNPRGPLGFGTALNDGQLANIVIIPNF